MKSVFNARFTNDTSHLLYDTTETYCVIKCYALKKSFRSKLRVGSDEDQTSTHLELTLLGGGAEYPFKWGRTAEAEQP